MRKEKLYRKVNTTAHGVHHHDGGDYRGQRGRDRASEAPRGAMHGSRRRGLDYTPLFRFLLSKVGSDWDGVFREAVSRLDRPDPVFWLVAQHEHQKQDVVMIGGNSYFSGLYVDADGALRKVNPDIGPEQMTPTCTCCTHTLNGVPFPRQPR